VGNASVIADAETSKENEDRIGGQQDQYRLQCRLVGEQKRLRIRQNSRQEVPDRNCERDPQDECDDPGRDIEAPGCGRHVGVCGECSDWHIGKKIADAHQAKPEEEHGPGAPFLLLCLCIKQAANDVGDAVADENSGNSDQRGYRAATGGEDGSVVDILIDIVLKEDVVEVQAP
jgi:hypothetical protein